MQPSLAGPQLTLVRLAHGVLLIRLAGAWRLAYAIPTIDRGALDDIRQIGFHATGVTSWDSSLVAFATRILELARKADIDVDRSGLPPGLPRLLELVETPPERTATPRPRRSVLTRIGLHVLDRRSALHRTFSDIGELVLALIKLASGAARFRRRELWLQIQAAGAGALGIVALVAGLVGLIIAFISAIQLRAFGASLYVASLVGIAMVRELGAVMAGIVIAGRTGAAFAAELGTMRVTQEIDALSTLGISRVEFLVLPRVLAVTLMLPLLTVFADLLGVIGGAVVGIGILHLAPRLYLDETLRAVSLSDLLGGLVKATTYGFLIGVSGCFIGLRTGRTAAAVGKAATSAVVAGIVLVIVACGTYAFVFYRLGI